MRLALFIVVYCGGFVGTGMGLDARDPSNAKSALHIAGAVTWPVWVPGTAVFHIVSGS